MNRKMKENSKMFILVASLFVFSAFIFGQFLMPRIAESKSDFLQANDLQIVFDDASVANYFTPEQLAAVKDKLVNAINNLPDVRVRVELVKMIKHKELNLRFSTKINGEFAFLGPFSVLGINPQILLENRLPLGYHQSFLVHEYRHIEDWQGKYMDSYLYKPCETTDYASRQCELEWWDAEWRAVKVHAEFLKKNHLIDAIPTGPAINNQEIFRKNSPDRAALEYLLKNYYSQDINKGLKEVWPDFYQKKLASLSS